MVSEKELPGRPERCPYTLFILEATVGDWGKAIDINFWFFSRSEKATSYENILRAMLRPILNN